MNHVHFLLRLGCLVVGGATTARAENYALLVGVTKYDHARMNDTQLKYPEADAEAVAELLSNSGYKVKLLLGRHATKRAVEDALKVAQKEGNADGVLLIGLFGHGTQYADTAYYATFDTTTRRVTANGKALFEKSGLPMMEPDPSTMVSMKSILRTLSNSGAGNLVLLADCCRKDPSKARGRAFANELKTTNLDQGTAVLFSCSKNEQAFEHDDWEHGAFTLTFLEECKRLMAENGRVRANALADKVHDRVLEIVRDKTKGQSQRVNPIISGIVDLKLNEFFNDFGMEFKFVPRPKPDAGTQPEKQLPLFVGVHEVTQSQWQAVMKTTPWKGRVKDAPDSPVTNISWQQADAFCNRLSEMDGRSYRLPTDEEWEFACRGGVKSKFHFGDDKSQLDQYAWTALPSQFQVAKEPYKVGLKKSNPYGLFDMYGNVWEWGSYNPYISGQPFKDGDPVLTFPASAHGGSWDSDADNVLSVMQHALNHRAANIGFRVVFTKQKFEFQIGT